MTGPQLFAMFLAMSYVDVSKSEKSLQLEMLHSAAEKGYVPAQAVMSRVSASYDIALDVDKAALYSGASSGALLAWHDLHSLDPALASQAWDDFRKSTGYNQFYSPVTGTSSTSVFTKDSDDNGYLHILSTYGEAAKIGKFLLTNGANVEVNAANIHGETALYKACLTGCRKTVEILCQYGANASVRSELDDRTCLHWLFNFPPAQVKEVALALVRANADVNALSFSAPLLVNCHFPFSWPSGTPLHFAVFASNPAAVVALLELGAQAGMRDGCDPYATDENVRQLHCHGNDEEGDFSEPDRPGLPFSRLGFSPVDLAAAMHDAEILRYFKLHSRESNLVTADAEGYTPFHRLSYLRLAKTYYGLRFWYPAFMGKLPDVKDHIVRTIKELQLLGGDIDQMTNTPLRPARLGVAGLTPLMIAVTKSDYTAVEALLTCGANPDVVNKDGRSALTLLPDNPSMGLDSILRIVSLLLKHGANVNHKSLDEMTPLGAAVAVDHLPTIRLLIRAGADLSCASHGVNIVTQLMYNRSYRRVLERPRSMSQAEAKAQEDDIASILREVDVSRNVWMSQVDKDNGNMLHYAASSGLVDCVKLLLRAGLDVNCIRKLHFTSAKYQPPNYSSIAIYMPQGTPLDVVEEQQEKFLGGGREQLSETSQSS